MTDEMIDPEGQASEDLRAEVTAIQESNRTRMAAAEALLGRLPNMTIGLLDHMADAVFGTDTAARWEFTLSWEKKVAAWCDATEAEIRKAEAMAGTPGAAVPEGNPLLGANGAKPKLVVARGGGMNGV